MLNNSKVNNIPKLRFPEFSGAWQEKRLGEVSQKIVAGASIRPEEFAEMSPYKVIPKKSISKSGLLSTDDRYLNHCTEGAFRKYKSSTVENSFLVTTLRDLVPSGPTLGYFVNYTSKESLLLAQGVYGLLFDENKIKRKFVIQLSNSYKYRKIMYELKNGSTQVHIRSSEFLKSVHFIPNTLEEQQKIASFLTTVDEWIENLRAQKATLEKYKKGMMQKIFSQKIRFKDDDGKEFPEWEEKRLGTVFSNKVERNIEGKIIEVLTNSATQGIVSQKDYFEREIAVQGNLTNYYIVKKDDFIYNPRISINAPVGPLKRNKLSEGVMSPLYTILRPQIGNLSFLEMYFQTSFWHKYMYQIANYGARHDRMAISQSDFRKMLVPFPCVPEQQKIAEFLSTIDDLITSNDEQISKAELWKKGLMQEMFV